ncbi:MAG: hypothetical protein FWG31_05775 [Oscillospiraceae bacterium]|nr:hypothetical protein [Oscillospiraceae bacterium]
MGKEGMGVGSASLILIFAVLCLTIFALISLTSAENDKVLTEVNAELVAAYYEADTLAEYILDEILSADVIPETIRGIDIKETVDFFTDESIIAFRCPVTEEKELYVQLSIDMFGYAEILNWKMQDTQEWSDEDDKLPVWQG